jgi:hypothetical protein
MANNVVTITFTTDTDVPQEIKAALRQALAVDLMLNASELAITVKNVVVTVL